MKLAGRNRSAFLCVNLLLGLAAFSASAVAQTPGTFTPTGNMTTPRRGHSATLLKDGRVLIAGGNFDGPPSAEIYDPATGTFTAIGNMIRGGMPVLLHDGRVLFIESTGVEVFDLSTGIFTDIAVGNLVIYHGGGTATLLNNGKVLITGGTNGQANCCAIAADPVIYDPSTQIFSLAGPYADTGAPSISATYGAGTSGLAFAPATLLANGKVLISSESAAELYDPVSNSFSLTASMTALGDYCGIPTSIYGRAATLLPNGNVLLTGGDPGCYDTGDFPLRSAELYVPSSGTFALAGDMALPRGSPAATLLADGTVLITGGGIDIFGTTSPIAEIYDPITGMFSLTGRLNSGRREHQATLLQDGGVLITGGAVSNVYPNESVLASAEVYTSPAGFWQQAINAMKAEGGSDSFNFWQWDWLWQRSPAFPGAPAGFGVLGSIDNAPGLIEKIIAGGGGDGLLNISAEQWVLYYRQALADPWQRAIAGMRASAGNNSLNFWQWAWYWQRSPAFAGAPAGFGVLGSIDNAPGTISGIIAAGGGNGFAIVSAEQWVMYYRQATSNN